MSKISQLPILQGEKNIFNDESVEYIIPLYQRAFSWTDKELLQLFEDIRDFNEDNYYIGSLIVDRKGSRLEVIDGQQRLTALFLLLSSLGISVDNTLKFECRDKSNSTLARINELSSMESVEESLASGKQYLERLIGKGFNREAFIGKLERVKLFCIEVPEKTDLNRYFEIMNTRGEQLEQHDVLKKSLMSAIKDADKRNRFARIWDACSDMTGYVQMHFDTRKNLRRTLFGDYWDALPKDAFKVTEIKVKEPSAEDGTLLNIRSIIQTKPQREGDEESNNDGQTRFESIITFPFFLLHTLKVFRAVMGIKHKNEGKDVVEKLLDDKKLLSAFRRVLENGRINGEKIDEQSFAIEFAQCLLRCRFLFDKFIIKREYVGENLEGEWSLKELKISQQSARRIKGYSVYYKNTEFRRKYEREGQEQRQKRNLMLQACLRVSYTSPKVMHWITELLEWLYCEENLDRLNEYEGAIEGIAQSALSGFSEDICKKGGVNTPHIIFNYLDYLIWKTDQRYGDFVFEFRNSVEHWYPQRPSEGTFKSCSVEEGLDSFGNLCLVQRNINSRFSNLSPEAKKSTFKNMISKGSLKLRLMAEMTAGDNATLMWKDAYRAKHENDMLKILNISFKPNPLEE